ncbi:2Fe-2S iron-sulfur cluster-binding protein [Mucilaginibacter sp. SP1R1]|uniref:2Fe-2S iron-sulfur cluster-binding protein n=1 Tax=Mucilaginibacter sp. SP1R1 TaxID=2723091 RepID=UPI00161D5F9C|nr:2Fe-2S iron-sulfur cluster-binding protein [Mucilaginibacter sp. SP1R1]MBB6148533.1 aerobic-type carbon monoxide dehydrogenase small subunit (CoxS/CutS family) [Mucilaginibacter sp. SP1R1]
MEAKNTILLTLYYRNESYQVQTNTKQYHSLMTLILDHLAIPGFGLCCGMGSCGTCLVQISNAHSSFKQTVLACGIQINDELANAHIFIPDNVY